MKTILGVDLKTGKKIFLNDKERRSGMYILGVQGRGKSALLLSLIAQDLEKGYSVIVLDPHDDLIRYAVALLPPERLQHTYLLDLDDTDFPFGLNLFACSDPTDEVERSIVVERVLHIFERHWPDLKGILLQKVLRYITLAFLECPGSTLADARRFLRDDDFRENLIRRLTNEEVKAYWLHEYNMMTPVERRKETQALDNRLAAFLSTPFVKNIVCQRQNTIDFQQAIQEQQVLLIRLPMVARQAHVSLIGTILLTHIHAATFASRGKSWNQRPDFSLYVDEFQHFATADFAELYKEGRKFGARITVAHQNRQDLIPENRSAVLTASTIVAFQLTPADAAEMAPIFFDSTEQLRPEHIYADPLRRLRLHEHPDIQEFFRRYVLSLQKEEEEQTEDALDILQDLLYQSVKAQKINESLFETYAEEMFSLLDLVFDELEYKREQLYRTFRQKQRDIAALRSILVSDQAFKDYLIAYHQLYLSYRYHRYPRSEEEWYYQPWVPENYLFANTKFWEDVANKVSHTPLEDSSAQRSERLEQVLAALQEEATENNKLCTQDTPEKILAGVRDEILAIRSYILDQLWEKLSSIHKLKSKYAFYPAIQQFHAQASRDRHSASLESEEGPLFWHPIGTRRKRSNVDYSTRVDELVIRPLALKSESSEEQIFAWLPDRLSWESEQPQGEVLIAWERAKQLYADLRQIDYSLRDETFLLRKYYEKIRKLTLTYEVSTQPNMEQIYRDVREAFARELQRNRLLSQMNTVEKIIQIRKNELRKKSVLLNEDAEAYKATLPNIEQSIEEERARIEQKRQVFCAMVRHVLQILIADPGPLGERRMAKESDTRERLLNLQKRQALVRVGGDGDQSPQKYLMQTLNLPQAVKSDELEHRLRQIREQTRAKYGRPRQEVEQELQRSKPFLGEEGKPSESKDSHGPWYEEE